MHSPTHKYINKKRLIKLMQITLGNLHLKLLIAVILTQVVRYKNV